MDNPLRNHFAIAARNLEEDAVRRQLSEATARLRQGGETPLPPPQTPLEAARRRHRQQLGAERDKLHIDLASLPAEKIYFPVEIIGWEAGQRLVEAGVIRFWRLDNVGRLWAKVLKQL